MMLDAGAWSEWIEDDYNWAMFGYLDLRKRHGKRETGISSMAQVSLPAAKVRTVRRQALVVGD